MWECPQIIEIDGQHALIVSIWDQDELYDVRYALGRYENGTFTADTWGHLSYGPSPYAATTFRDSDDRPCVMFWLRGIEGDGWAGAHSLPYQVTIQDDRLFLSPHPDLDLYHDGPETSGRAADISWPEHIDTTLQIVQHAIPVLTITRDREELHIRVGDESHQVPCEGEVRVILDGPILEISSRAGVFASPITPLAEDWELVGAGLIVRRLRQQVLA